VIQDSYTLSSSVNKCITICTPSIQWLYRLANPLTYLVRDAGTINGYRVATIPLIRSQVVAFAFRSIDYPRRRFLYDILRHSNGISLYIPSSRKSIRFEPPIRHSI